MKKVVLVLIVLTIFSCGKEKKEEKKVVDIPEKIVLKDNIFKISLDVKIGEDDKFRVFYSPDSPEDKFSGENMKVVSIKGNTEFQLVSINLPEGVIPYKLRIDLGEGGIKSESEIEIKIVNFELNGKRIDLDTESFDKYFRANKYLEKTVTGYKRKVIEGKYDPFLVSRQSFIDRIELEL